MFTALVLANNWPSTLPIRTRKEAAGDDGVGKGKQARWAEHEPHDMCIDCEEKRRHECPRGKAPGEETECGHEAWRTHGNQGSQADKGRRARDRTVYISRREFPSPQLRKLPSNGPKAALC